MSSTTTRFTEEQHRREGLVLVGKDYVPTEDEIKVFKECNNESFWYRSVPFSLASMAITKALASKGIVSSSQRFGAVPKVIFAGFCGYLAGKMSYIKTCQEKFKRLENSPLGEMLRQKAKQSQRYQSELSDSDTLSFDPTFEPAEAPSQLPSNTRDYEYGFKSEPPMQMERTDEFSPPASAQSHMEEQEPRRKPTLYEDLRLKNRENYEVTLTQKAETLLKSTSEKEGERAKKDVKKNIYGDTWEE